MPRPASTSDQIPFQTIKLALRPESGDLEGKSVEWGCQWGGKFQRGRFTVNTVPAPGMQKKTKPEQSTSVPRFRRSIALQFLIAFLLLLVTLVLSDLLSFSAARHPSLAPSTNAMHLLILAVGVIGAGWAAFLFRTSLRSMEKSICRIREHLFISGGKQEKKGETTGETITPTEMSEAIYQTAGRCTIVSTLTDRILRKNEMLHQCHRLLFEQEEKQVLLEGICKILVHTGGYRMAWIGESVNDSAQSIVPIAQEGFSDIDRHDVVASWADSLDGRGPIGTAMRTGEVSIARNIDSDPRFRLMREKAMECGYRSSAAFPIEGADRITGVLNVFDSEKNAFPENEVTLLRNLTEVLSRDLIRLEEKKTKEMAEVAARENEQKYRTLFEHALDAIVVTDAETEEIVDCNDEAHQLLEFPREELLQFRLIDLDAGNSPEGIQSHIASTVAKGFDRFESRQRTNSGSIRDVLITSNLIQYGGRECLQSVIRDVTDWKRNETEWVKLISEKTERIKELTCMYGLMKLVRDEKSLPVILKKTVDLIPPSWQFPEITCGRILFQGNEYRSDAFLETEWRMKSEIHINGISKGSVEVFYREEMPELAEGPFLAEERELINGISGALGEAIERSLLESEVLNISEEERRRIGQDLHDGLCQELKGAEFMMTALEREITETHPADAGKARKISTIINRSVCQTREIARGLFPIQMEEEGVVVALREHCRSISDIFGIDCGVDESESEVCCPEILEQARALQFYRIAQEAIGNAIQHGKADRVRIRFYSIGGEQGMTVMSNGIDFISKGKSSGGSGIRLMHYRAGLIGATLQILVPPGGGTVVKCILGKERIPE